MELKAPSTLSSAEVSFFTHATEDSERFLKTISAILEVAEDLFQASHLTGHFGNPIVKFTARVRGRDADRLAGRITGMLDPGERDTLRREISEHIDEHGSLYLRIDKQGLFSGRVAQSQVDAVKIRFKPRFKRSPSEILNIYCELLKAT